MPTLYEIHDDYIALQELLLEAGAELDAESALAFDRLFADFETDEAAKAESYYRLIRKFEMEAAAAKSEAEQYAMMARVRQNAAERLKARMKSHLEFTERMEVTTTSGKRFTITPNGGNSPVVMEPGLDLSTLPARFVKVIPETRQLDTDAVREELKAGSEFPFARLGQRGTHLRIK